MAVSIMHLFPIGTVIKLEDWDKPLMIVGIKQNNPDNPRVINDYVAVMYPEGLMAYDGNLSSTSVYWFDQRSVKDVVFRGYESEAHKNHLVRLDQFFTLEEMRKNKPRKTLRDVWDTFVKEITWKPGGSKAKPKQQPKSKQDKANSKNKTTKNNKVKTKRSVL